jgi:hypothetical protein
MCVTHYNAWKYHATKGTEEAWLRDRSQPFSGSLFSGATVKFDRATLSGATVDFSGAVFSGGAVDFSGVVGPAPLGLVPEAGSPLPEGLSLAASWRSVGL